MTVIMGYMGANNYYIASDNEVTDSGDPVAIGEAQAKIHDFGEFLIGSTGKYKSNQALEKWKPPKRNSKETLHDYIKNKVVPALEKRLMEFKVMGEVNKIPDFDETCTKFLIVCKEGIYLVGHDMCCVKLKDRYHAIGCGGDIALGALGLSCLHYFSCGERQILRAACDLAAKHCNGVNDDFQVIERNYRS